MIPLNSEAAVKHSIELAKILCESAGNKFIIDEDAANQIADFIETMEYRLTHKENEATK